MLARYKEVFIAAYRLIGLILLIGLPGERAFAQASTAFLPNYFPSDYRQYGFRTFRQTFGGTGEFTTKIPEKVTVPYTSGAVSGIWGYDPIEDDYFAVSIDSAMVRVLADKSSSGEIGYYSLDCSLSAPSPALSFGSVQDETIVQGPVYLVRAEGLVCEGGEIAKTLFTIQHVRVLQGYYQDSVVFWELSDEPFVPLNLWGKELSLGIKIPTISDTQGHSVTSFSIYGLKSGLIAAGDIATVSGELTELWELVSVNQGSWVSTVVGKGPILTDGGPALSAQIFSPAGSAIDSQGNLYFADKDDYRVWKVTPAGIISYVAGNGRRGFSGDGGPARSAQLNDPVAVALDSSGNLYIADQSNHRIRKVSSNGTISTFAGNGTAGYGGDGGQAISAQLSSPLGLAISGGNALLVVENNTHRIRKIDSSGIITTIAGTGAAGFNGDDILATAAQLNSPTGLAVGPDGSVYIVDSGNGRVRRIDTGGIIRRFAGDGNRGSPGQGDGGPAYSAQLRSPGTVAVDSLGNAYIGEDDRVRQILFSSGVIRTVVGGGSNYLDDGIPATQAAFGPTRGLAVDSAGNLYVSEYFSRVRKAVVGGLITTVAGTSHFCGDGGSADAACIFWPHGVAWDAFGNYHVADTGNQRVRKISPDGSISSFVSFPQVILPTALAFDKSGNLFIADSAYQGIWKADPTGKVSIFAGGGNQRPGDNGPATAAQVELGMDVGMAFDKTGNLYFTQSHHGHHGISKVTPSGIISTVAGIYGSNGYSGDGGFATEALLDTPGGLAFDDGGNLYFADSGNNRIRKITPDGIISTVAGNGLATFSGDGGPARMAALNYPAGIAVDKDGSIVIGDQHNNRIRKILGDGSITTIAGTGTQGFNGDGGPPTDTELALPTSIAFGPDGTLFFADSYNHRIRTIVQGEATCVYAISPTSQSVAGTGYSSSVAVTTGSSCNWTAASNVGWMTITLGSSGSGNGTVNYAVAANASASSRTGTLTIAGQVFTVSQSGRPNPVPAISDLSPSGTQAGSPAIDLTVVGTNFVSGSTVRWNNENLSTTFLGSTQLRAAIPAADLAAGGAASVTVFSPAPGGGLSNPLSFAVTNPAPSLCCLNPISVVAAGPALSLIVYGSGFVPSSTVQWNGSSQATTFVSSTELHAAIPSTYISSAGTANITVSNPAPGGGISGVQTLSIITLAPGAPTITSVSPDVLPAGGESFTLTVNGTGFVSGSVVQFNGQDRPTTFVSATQLTVVIPASDIAAGLTYGIVVVNPASGSSGFVHTAGILTSTQGIASNTGVVTVLNPVPVLSGVTPSSARAGSVGFSVTAAGEKFVSTSTIRWNGADRATTFTSVSRLGGTVLAGDIAAEATASTSVSNPGPGGGTSNSLTFTIRTSKAASTTLYYPRLVTNSSETTGIAVANLSGTDAVLTLWAFDKAGAELKGQDITNPVSVSIKGVEQLPIVDWQLFGSGLPAKSPVGWAKVESTASKIAGFFLTFNDTLSTMDGANVSSTTLTSIVFPEIEDEGFTQIHLANPDTAAADLRFELYKSDGTLRGGTVTRKINSNGTVAESLSDLFPGAPPEGSDHIRVTSTKGVVPFEYLGKTEQYVEGLNGQDANSGATTLYSPQYAAGGGYRTALSVVNLESVAGTVTLELIGDDGTLLANPKQVAIPARGKLHITDQKFFVDSAGSLVQGYIRITSSGPKLAGSVVFGDPERKHFSSSLPLVSDLVTSAIFGQVASNGTYFTGIAILNPNEATATATIDVLDRNGNLVRTRAEMIGAKRRVSKLVTQYFEDLVGQDIASGYIKVTVDKGVASFALFGTNDLSVLSAIPPQVVP